MIHYSQSINCFFLDFRIISQNIKTSNENMYDYLLRKRDGYYDKCGYLPYGKLPIEHDLTNVLIEYCLSDKSNM